MAIDLRWIPGDARIEDAHAVRRAVFIEGQDVDEALEMDGRDDEAIHVVAYLMEGTEGRGDSSEMSTVTSDNVSDASPTPGQPVGTARLRFPEPGIGKPERVAVRESFREQGIGRDMMEALTKRARAEGCTRLILHAQTTVEKFYADLGYETTSDVFQEAGIPHVKMERSLDEMTHDS